MMFDFPRYAFVVMKTAPLCQGAEGFLGCVRDAAGRPGQAEFTQHMVYNSMEMLSSDFDASPDEVAQQHTTFRGNSVKHRFAFMHCQRAR